MRRRRFRGFGCLGCLPFGGIVVAFLPLILIAAVIYFLVNRQRTNPPPQQPPPQPPHLPPATPPAPTPPGQGEIFCSRCGRPAPPGSAILRGLRRSTQLIFGERNWCQSPFCGTNERDQGD